MNTSIPSVPTLLVATSPKRCFCVMEKYEFRVMGETEIYDKLSNSPIDRLKEATGASPFDVRISFVDSLTGIELMRPGTNTLSQTETVIGSENRQT